MKAFRVLLSCALFFLFSFSQVQAFDEDGDDGIALDVGLAMWFDAYEWTGSGWDGPFSDLYWEVTGKARIPGTLQKKFFIFEITGELEEETGFWGVTSKGDVNLYARFGAEIPYFRNLEVGSFWDYQEGGETYRGRITAIEDVTVTAGLFRDCVRVRRQRITGPDPGPGMIEWFSVGFGLVQEIDLGDSPPTLLMLRSIEWLDYDDDD